jgi:hypothetical protein
LEEQQQSKQAVTSTARGFAAIEDVGDVGEALRKVIETAREIEHSQV